MELNNEVNRVMEKALNTLASVSLQDDSVREREGHEMILRSRSRRFRELATELTSGAGLDGDYAQALYDYVQRFIGAVEAGNKEGYLSMPAFLSYCEDISATLVALDERFPTLKLTQVSSD